MKALLIILSIVLASPTLGAGWIKKANLGGVARHRATGVSISQKGYIGLGHVNGSGVNYAYEDWWEYDPSTNSWTQKADFAGGLNYGALAWSTEQYVYVGGGVYNGQTFYRFDPTTNTWSPIATCPLSVSDRIALDVDNYGIVITSSGGYKYDEPSNTWIAITPPPSGPGFWNATFTIGGSAYLVYSSTCLEYKASADAWAVKASFPGLATGGYAGFTAGGHGYIVGGYSGSLGNVTDETWEYDPATNSWSLSEEFIGTSRRFHVAFTIGDQGYVGCGTNGTNFKDFYVFNRYLDASVIDEIDVKLYPNPVVDHLSIELSERHQGVITVLDAAGKTVLETPLSNIKELIDVSSLQYGMYHLRVALESGVVSTRSFIKQ